MSTSHHQSVQSLPELASLIKAEPGFPDVVSALRGGHSAAIHGAWGSSCALSICALAGQLQQSVLLVVVPTIRDAQDLADELESLLPQTVRIFPAWETLPDEHDISDSVFAGRLAGLQFLHTARDSGDHQPRGVLITCLPALLQPVPSRATIEEATREIAVGDEFVTDQLTDWLLSRGFERVTAVELPGEFCLHGGIIDIFPPTRADPIRIELFGDEVESIRSFDVETQRRVEDLTSFKLTATQPVKAPTTEQSATAPETDKSDAESLLDSLPEKTIVVLNDMQQAISEGKMYLQRLANPVGLYGVDATMARLTEFPSVTIDALGVDSFETTCRLRTETLERFSGSRQEALLELSELLGTDEHALICCHNEAEVERLNEVIDEAELRDGLQLRHRLMLCTGRILNGFRLLEHRIAVLSDNELFSRATSPSAKRKRRTDTRAIDSFLDLRDGDLVVHLTHGIGRYRGITMMQSEGHEEEHLLLEFRDGLIVYVPVSLIHLVQKYIGPAKTTPELSKIGGTAWAKKKKQVAEAVSDMASEMLRLQAERDSKPGLQCGPNSHLQEEFGRAFPYTPTVDQVSAIRDFAEDMERSRPMDRLLCGDVGFGKTEVAMRAAFKAVDNGRQVAVLVPTTVLAEQHFRTFSERMAEFPISIESLSRFRSAAEQRKIVQRLKTGELDVVIGTHRLVSKDVHFKNLGLLVIDEEQKFGVKVKDKLKHLRLEVDILTMTATPIPRTLHMSLLGIRDISSLTTPPRDRVPIETRVGRFDESLIRSAIIRELNRGGQIYFVHNRVHDIEEVANQLRRIVPEATLTIGHGQMHEDDLEAAMLEFVTGKADILLATTIIESGLDIPNANTMFIHQADIYGLADLHQLRGRVGRDRHRAYCYLLLEDGKAVTPKATKRLRAIEEYSELGAGFRIAMRDLEIRGAGNILGTEQSGNIAAVGYELYCQLLENSVRSLKKQPLRYQRHCRIELPVSAYLPDKYVSEQKLKIEVYRRLSQANTLEQLSELEEELRDRFGPVPMAARRMLQMRELNLRAVSWHIENIFIETGYGVLRYRNGKMIRILAHLHDRHLKVVDKHDAYWPLECDEEDGPAVLEELLGVVSVAEPPDDQESATATRAAG